MSIRDSNGVEVTDFQTRKIYGMHINHFDTFDPTSATYIYNDAGGSAIASGEVDLEEHVGLKTLVVSVPTLGSTSIDFRIEGKVGTMATWSNVYTFNVSAAHGAGEDIIVPIMEYLTAFRIGVKVNTNGTDVINCRTTVISSNVV